MDKQLLEIEPSELKFVFELKKQSSCSVQLTNNTYHHVAFKVKTTSPKKYSVRPNVGVLMPKSTCEFIVTMQAQQAAPTDMACKDKFLILSTIVPVETTNEDITSSLFVKDDSKYVVENKLKVALITPAHSPELSPINGALKNELANQKDPNFCRDEILAPECMVLNSEDHKMVNEELKHEKGSELKSEQDVEELKPENDVLLKTVKDAEELTPKKEAELKVSTELKSEQDMWLNTMKDVEELKPENDVLLKTVKDAEELKPKKEAELKVSTELKSEQDVGLNTTKDVEEMTPENDVLLKTVKDAEELKPKKEPELEVSTELKSEQDVGLNTTKDVEELKPDNDVLLKTVKDAEELKPKTEAELKLSTGVEELKLIEAIEEMKLKLNELESKLNEAELTISKLTEDRQQSNAETKILHEKLADLSKRSPRKVQVGFPLLYVLTVALVCVLLGYRLHS